MTGRRPRLRTIRFAEVPLDAAWSDVSPNVRCRSRYVTHWMAGSRSSASVYFEVEPEAEYGRHYHSAEETIIVMAGVVEVTVGEEVAEIASAGLVVAPALVPHNIRCVGSETAKCVGVWSSSSVVSIWDEPLQPRGSRRFGTPLPDGI